MLHREKRNILPGNIERMMRTGLLLKLNTYHREINRESPKSSRLNSPGVAQARYG